MLSKSFTIIKISPFGRNFVLMSGTGISILEGSFLDVTEKQEHKRK